MTDPRPPREGVVVSGGVRQHVSPERVETIQVRFDRELGYAEKAQTHIWSVMTIHQLSDQMALAMTTEGAEAEPLLDLETLRSIQVGCYRCEEPLNRRLVGKRCQGEPG